MWKIVFQIYNFDSGTLRVFILEQMPEEHTMQKKLAQLPAVDMQKLQGRLWCYSNLSPRIIQPIFDAQ